jgi:hypothetical protein
MESEESLQPLQLAISFSNGMVRFGGNKNRQAIRAALQDQADWSINQCLEVGADCRSLVNLTRGMSLMTAFFCGHHPDCRLPSSPAALERAKSNLQHEYLFVGLTEQYDVSLLVFERLLPVHFNHVLHYLAKRGASNVNTHKLEPLTDANRRILNSLGADGELYQFAAKLLRERLLKCAIASNAQIQTGS